MNREILHILGCPECKGNLDLKDEEEVLICKNCQLKFKIENDIPILLPEKAKKYSID